MGEQKLLFADQSEVNADGLLGKHIDHVIRDDLDVLQRSCRLEHGNMMIPQSRFRSKMVKMRR